MALWARIAGALVIVDYYLGFDCQDVTDKEEYSPP